MLEHEETLALIVRAQGGDEGAKELLLVHNAPLLKSIIRRFRNKGVEYEDLYQLACVGFVKAVNNFDTSFSVRFSTYAVPMILGELKRFLRDDGYLKVSRSVKLLSINIYKFVDEYKKQNEGDPPLALIAKKFGIDEQEVVFAMDSARMPVSLFERADDSDERSNTVMDKIPSGENEEAFIDRIVLKNAMERLSEREKKIVLMRYFRDQTQSEIARALGVSQVQVSRLEAKIIEKLRSGFQE